MSKVKLLLGPVVLLSAGALMAAAQAAVGYGMAAASSATSTAASAPRMSGAYGGVHRRVSERTTVVHRVPPVKARGTQGAQDSRGGATARALPPRAAVVGAAARPVSGGITVVGSETKQPREPE